MTRERGTSATRWWAGASLFYLSLVYFAFGAFSLVDYGGFFIFGAGTYYVMLLALFAVGWAIWIICSTVDAHYKADNCAGSKAAALLKHPRFVWDIWTYNITTSLVLALLVCVLVTYMAKHGYDANPHLYTAPTYGVLADIFVTDALLIVISFMVLFMQNIDAISAYCTKPYQLAELKQIGEEVPQPDTLYFSRPISA